MTFDSDRLLDQLNKQRTVTDSELDDRIGRAILGGLRHKSPSSPLRHDCFGLVQLEQFTQHIECRFHQVECLRFRERVRICLELLTQQEKIEIRGQKIRALYGHSLPGVIAGELKWPDSLLYHATRRRHLDSIFKHGLQSQSRTWVHLTTDSKYAATILANHDYEGHSVLLSVTPSLLENADVTFRKPNSHVWLASHIPPCAIRVSEPNDHSEIHD